MQWLISTSRGIFRIALFGAALSPLVWAGGAYIQTTATQVIAGNPNVELAFSKANGSLLNFIDKGSGQDLISQKAGNYNGFIFSYTTPANSMPQYAGGYLAQSVSLSTTSTGGGVQIAMQFDHLKLNGTALNVSAKLVVTTGGGSSPPFATNAQLYSPAFFPWPGNQPVATHLDYSIAARNGTFSGVTTVPAKPGEVITLWGTGFGPTNPLVPAGQEPAAQAPPTQNPVTVTLGGTAVPVLGSVLSSYAAVYQIAIQIPTSMPDGDYPIIALANAVQSPANFSLTVQHSQ